MPRAVVFALLLCSMIAWPAEAQEPAPLDTSRVYALDQIVVTADRSASRVANSTAAVSVLREEELRRLPVRGLAGALEQTPGFAFLNVDGLGYNPQATVRGFYGGGEAAYVVVLVDGRPLNNLEAGLVNWNQLPLAGVASVEVLRGGASSLYGDAAIGGVINVVTDASAVPSARLSVAGGSYGSFTGAASLHRTWQGRPVSVFGDLERTDGFREHAGRAQGSAGASVALVHAPRRTLTLSTLNHWRRFDSPGPLTGAALAADREQTSAFYQFDETDEQTYRLALDGTAVVGSGAGVAASVTGELRTADVVRTLPLAPGFADTKHREVDAARLLGSAQMTVEALPVPFENRLVVGADVSVGRLESAYFDVVSGGAEAYQGADGAGGARAAAGAGRRATAAAFVHYDVRPVPRVRLSAGARLDWLRDTYDPDAPEDTGEESTSHTAFSPKAGINVRYVQSARHVGNVYANVARSFKAPTLDQLFDQRALPVEFPPFSVTISNPDLDPQHGTSVEAGLYHRADLVRDLSGEVSLAVYQIDMTDEIDFSFETFQNVNVGKSRHRGVESGLKLYWRDQATVFVNYTLQDVTFRNGDNEGNVVKAIPRHFVSGGVSASHASGLGGTVTVRTARRIYLDDANTIRLPTYTTVDARLAYRFSPITIALDAFNLFDAAYSTTGFPDPSGADVVYFYPASGRALRLGLAVAW